MVRGLVAEEADEFGGVGFGDGDVFDAGMVYFGKDALGSAFEGTDVREVD